VAFKYEHNFMKELFFETNLMMFRLNLKYEYI